jgi:hypothetical protein
MSYPLRLPAVLDAEARALCERTGVSLNGLIALALDAYLRGAGSKAVASKQRKQLARKAPAAAVERPRSVEGGGGGEEQFPWREVYDPDMWPYVDPEFAARREAVNPDDEAACVELELEYWSTRQRPDEVVMDLVPGASGDPRAIQLPARLSRSERRAAERKAKRGR